MEIIKFIGVLTSVWMFVEGASIFKIIKEALGIANSSAPKVIYLRLIQKLVNCAMCSGFWFGLAVYLNFWMACCVSISAELYRMLINHIFEKYQKL